MGIEQVPKANLKQWTQRARRRLKLVLAAALRVPELRRLGPPALVRETEWQVDVELTGLIRMKRLNLKYRGKNHGTDILSFPAPEVFFRNGHLGELVICAPVLERQAKEQGHSQLSELDVLLAHGVVHLLGLDHELGEREAAQMGRLEGKLLLALGRKRASGLIGRTRSGKPLR